MDRLMTYREAAGTLGIAYSNVKKLVATGSLPVVRIGAVVRIRPAALAAFVEEREGRAA